MSRNLIRWLALTLVLALGMALCGGAAMASAVAWHVYPTDEQRASFARQVLPEGVQGFLPVCHNAATDRKVVAFTIDDCNQVKNLQTIISLFQQYGGTATIFPIGENVPYLTDTLRNAWMAGFEIENHTYTHSGLYHEDDEGLAYQIWMQNRAVSEALGVDYQMHFLRPRGGDNRYDQRTHAYLRQMGYYGIAYWDQVGVLAPTKIKPSDVQSGDILLFHTTDQDVAQLKELVPQLASMGFGFVTLNDLYGLPANETNVLTPNAQVEPIHPWMRFDQTYHPEEYLHDIYLIQERLTELGFLNSPYNGYYGKKTVAAVRAFQKSVGLEADGITGKATWDALFGTN